MRYADYRDSGKYTIQYTEITADGSLIDTTITRQSSSLTIDGLGAQLGVPFVGYKVAAALHEGASWDSKTYQQLHDAIIAGPDA